MGKVPARVRRNGKVIAAVHPDAAHCAEQPFDHGTLGIMIQRGNAVVLGGVALPCFPDGGRTAFGHKQPAGHFLVFQKTVSGVYVDFRQHRQNQRRGQKARADTPAEALQRRKQAFLRVAAPGFVQQVKRQRAHKLCLPVGIQGIQRRAAQCLIAFAAACGKGAVGCGFLLVAERRLHFRHTVHHMGGVGGGGFGVRHGAVLPCHVVDALRLCPFAVGLPIVGKIFLVLPVQPGAACGGVPFAAALLHKAGIAAHTGQVFL